MSGKYISTILITVNYIDVSLVYFFKLFISLVVLPGGWLNGIYSLELYFYAF